MPSTARQVVFFILLTGAAPAFYAQAVAPDRPPQEHGPTILPNVQIYTEFQRIDPFGNSVPADKSSHPREVLSPGVPRNAHVSFHIAVTVPPGENYFLFVVPNPLNACGVEMYREHFKPLGGAWVPDELIKIERLPEFGVMPDPEQRIPGQNTRAYLLDLWIPQDGPPPGFRLEVQMKIGYFIVRPMEVRILPARVPALHPFFARLPLPPAEASADAPAVQVLNEYVAGRLGSFLSGTPLYAEHAVSLRDIVRRNAVQDMVLAGTAVDGRLDAKALAARWKNRSRDAGAEQYLQIRDFIFRSFGN